MKVLIADDHSIVREGVKQVLESMPSVSWIDEAGEGFETLTKVKSCNYDFVVLDLSMPGISGMEILQRIKDLGLNQKVLVLSFHPQEQYARRAFNLGASGYLSKNCNFSEIKEAMMKISDGGRYISSCFAEKLAFGDDNSQDCLLHEKLSDREFQVMIMLAQGETVTAISKKLFVSDKTVSTYRSRILHKLNLDSNSALTGYALRNGLIE
jgi:two-component system, NarL family, invasion response regulator UvrY